MAALRLVFLGSDAIALPLLQWLSREGSPVATVVGVFTQPDRPAGRGQRVQPNAIKAWAQDHGLPVFQPEKLTEDVRVELAGLQPDVGLIMAYGHLLKDDFIATPRLGMLNLHTSVLPAFRGASPIQTAVASGVAATGVTLMRIVRRLDAGPIAGCETVPVSPLDTAVEVENRLAAACVPLVAKSLPLLSAGTLDFVPQDDAQATFCRKLRKEDGVLDFAAPARVLAARVNGLFPWPVVSVSISGQAVRIGQAEAVADAPEVPGAVPGEVLGSDSAGLRLATGAGVLRFRRLQRAGGRMLEASEFLRGFPVPAGTRLPSLPMPALVERR